MPSFGLNLVTEPAAEPITLATAKLHLRLEFPDDDALVTALIQAAREYVEHLLNRTIFNQVWLLTLDAFPAVSGSSISPAAIQDSSGYAYYYDGYAIRLPQPKLVSVDSITYVDGNGQKQSLDPTAYVVDTNSAPARIVAAKGGSWPYPGVYAPGTVQVTYTTGTYGDGVDITKCPASIAQAMLLLIGHWYANREAVSTGVMTQVPLAVEALLSPHRFHNLMVV